MLNDQQNQNPVVNGQQLQQVTTSTEDLLKRIGSLEKTIGSVRLENRVVWGLVAAGTLAIVVAFNWAAVTSAFATIGGFIAANVLAIGIIAGSLAAVGLLALAGYGVYKYKDEINQFYKDKIVEGAKSFGRGAKKVYEHSRDSVKRITSRELDRFGNFVREAAHSGEYSIRSDLAQDIFKREGVKDLVNDTAKIVKANNSCVLEKIQEKVTSLIDSKVKELKGLNLTSGLMKAQKDDLIKQKNAVNKLKEVFTRKMPDLKDLGSVAKIFSHYQSQIKDILDDYKQHPESYRQRTFSQKMRESIRRKSIPNSPRGSIAGSDAGSDTGLVNPSEHKKVESTSSWMSPKSWFRSKSRSWDVPYGPLDNESTSSRTSSIAESLDEATSLAETTTDSIEFTRGDSGRGSLRTALAKLTRNKSESKEMLGTVSAEFVKTEDAVDNSVTLTGFRPLDDESTLSQTLSTESTSSNEFTPVDSGIDSPSTTPVKIAGIKRRSSSCTSIPVESPTVPEPAAPKKPKRTFAYDSDSGRNSPVTTTVVTEVQSYTQPKVSAV